MPTTAYQPDVLGLPFEQRVLPQLPDCEGAVQSTLVRLRPTTHGTKALLYIHSFNDYFFRKKWLGATRNTGTGSTPWTCASTGSWLPHQLPNSVRDLREYHADIDAALAVLHAEGCATVLCC